MEAIRDEDFITARKALAHGADLCDQMRMHMNHLLRTEDFTELEASLRAADGHLEMNAAEEAFGGSCAGHRSRWRRWNGWPGGSSEQANKKAVPAPEQIVRKPTRLLLCFASYFLRSPISFFSSLKKLSTSANCW